MILLYAITATVIFLSIAVMITYLYRTGGLSPLAGRSMATTFYVLTMMGIMSILYI